MENDLVEAFKSHFLNAKGFPTIRAAIKFAEQIPNDLSKKEIEELIEASLVRAGRELIRTASDPLTAFDSLVNLYARQPNLSTRTSTSIRQQAYSTPLPIAYLANVLAGITSETTVYEPCAGNGALLLATNPKRVLANELNPNRAAELRRQGYQVSETDAVDLSTEGEIDVVIMNPPFGSIPGDNQLPKSWFIQGGEATKPYKTKQIDHVIAFKGLQAMADTGCAVLILGAPLTNKIGNAPVSSETYNNATNRAFYKSLYDNYNVVKHFCISGDLYARQGTTFPIDMIVIEGRGKSKRKLPAARLPIVYRSFNELREVLIEKYSQTRSYLESSDRGLNVDSTNARYNPTINPRFTDLPKPTLEALREYDPPRQSDGTDRELSQGVAGDSTADGRQSGGLGRMSDELQPTPPGDFIDSEPASISPRASPSNSRTVGNPRINDRRGVDRRDDRQVQGKGLETMDNEANEKADLTAETTTQVPYQPRSLANSVGSLVPANLEIVASKALRQLESRVGSIDRYVGERLGVEDPTILHQRFSAEQIDALGLAFHNLERGEGFIIGDQTGVGKGRFVAGVIEFTRKKGLIPVFVTQDPKLYGDIFRDLSDIGVNDLNPLATNNALSIPLPNGKTLRTGLAKEHQNLLGRFIEENNIGSYDAIFTTYSQLQSVKKLDTQRRELLRRLAHRTVLVLDESHNAGGTFKEWNDFGPIDRADYVRDLVERAAGVVYSSATYAKNPYVMTLYSPRTGIRYGAANQEELVSTIQAGGIPLQQIMAAQLTEAGQYLRRERSYEGIEFGARTVAVNRDLAENMARVMRQIMAFDEAKQSALFDLNEELKEEAKRVSQDNAIGGVGASSTNFTSLMHNFIGQSLLAMRANATANRAIESLQAGEKPVIVVSNTMGSFIGDFAENNMVKLGETIDVSMGDLLIRYLQRSRDVTIKDYDGESKRQPLTDEQLGPEAVNIYNETFNLINQTDWGQIPISPIDWIRSRLEQAGYSVAEITGRQHRVDYSGGLQVYAQRGGGELGPAAAMGNVNRFNDGTLDCLIINRSGSTGISLHASSKFADQRPRRMLIAQAEPNIDQFMQTLGRIHRTGQVELPRFELLLSDLPAEKRPAAVLLRKMASLNANTTAARQSGFQLGGIIDFMNAYGDQVAADLMITYPSLHRELGRPLPGVGGWDVEVSDLKTEGAMARVTGRIPVLPIHRQEWVYNKIEEGYRELLDREIAMGSNVLEAQTLDIRAKTLATLEVIPAIDGIDSPFASAVYAEIVDAKTTRLPHTSVEVINQVRDHLGIGLVDRADQHNFVEVEQIATQVAANQVTSLESITESVKSRNLQRAENNPKIKHIEKQNAQIDRQFLHVASLLQQLPVGTPVRFYKKSSKNQVVNYGVITGVEQRYLESAQDNPTNPRNWLIKLAVANATVEVKIPFSRINTIDTESIVFAPQETVLFRNIPVYDYFDQQRKPRELRTIFTGSPIRAYQDFVGQFINYTDADGKVRQGMIMESDFDLQEQLANKPVKLSSKENCQQFFEQTSGYSALKSGDDCLEVKENRRNGGLFLRAESSKSQGGRYYLDEELLTIAGGEFESSGKKMLLKVTPERADAVLSYLYANNTPLFARERLEIARDIEGITLPDFDGLQAILDELPPHVELEPVNQLSVLANLEASLRLTVPEPSEVDVMSVEQEQQLQTEQAFDEQTAFYKRLDREVLGWPSAAQQALSENLPKEDNRSLGEFLAQQVNALRVDSNGSMGIEDALVSLRQKYVTEANLKPTSEQSPRTGYSPNLQDLRNWVADARLLGKSPKYVERIKVISGEFLAGTPQEKLPVPQRDPNFRNPDFTLSDSAESHRSWDAAESKVIRTPSRGQLLLWYQISKASGEPQAKLEEISRAAQLLLEGTEQENLPPEKRDANFINPNFQLKASQFFEMDQAMKKLQLINQKPSAQIQARKPLVRD
jgi:hypothetical protein